MINTAKLKGLITERGTSQRQLAKMLGMTDKTFYSKMRKGVFDSDEIQQMISILSIENPIDIFFASNVTC